MCIHHSTIHKFRSYVQGNEYDWPATNTITRVIKTNQLRNDNDKSTQIFHRKRWSLAFGVQAKNVLYPCVCACMHAAVEYHLDGRRWRRVCVSVSVCDRIVLMFSWLHKYLMTVPKKPTIYYSSSWAIPLLLFHRLLLFSFFLPASLHFGVSTWTLFLSLHFYFYFNFLSFALSKLTAVRSTAASTTSTLALFRSPVLYYHRLIDFRYTALCTVRCLFVRHHSSGRYKMCPRSTCTAAKSIIAQRLSSLSSATKNVHIKIAHNSAFRSFDVPAMWCLNSLNCSMGNRDAFSATLYFCVVQLISHSNCVSTTGAVAVLSLTRTSPFFPFFISFVFLFRSFNCRSACNFRLRRPLQSTQHYTCPHS